MLMAQPENDTTRARGGRRMHVFMSCPKLVHCVFEVDAHGSRYTAVSNYLKVYHAPTDYNGNLRNQIRVVPHVIYMRTRVGKL